MLIVKKGYPTGHPGPDLFKAGENCSANYFRYKFEQDGLVQTLCQGAATLLQFWPKGNWNVSKVFSFRFYDVSDLI